jgi:hypothetical protein
MRHGTSTSATSTAWLLVLGLAALVDCEQRFSAYPPPLAPETAPSGSSSSTLDALFGPAPGDAGSPPPTQDHAMTITLCSVKPGDCPSPDDGGSTEPTYRVALGSARGSIRSRRQATTDLYQELRDRTAAGERTISFRLVDSETDVTVRGFEYFERNL